jgi:peptidyl-tRNA hydrolase, PTH1 family
VVGLGNPGREHAGTRHNVGFMVAEQLAERWDLGRARDRFRGRLSEGRAGAPPAAGSGETQPPHVALLCPRGAYKLPLDRVLVVHDEIDLPFGEVRTRVGGGLAGHNGLKSIKRELGSADFMRVRVGVGRPASSDPEIVSAYVLGRFREDEAQVRELVDRACAAVEATVLGALVAGREG